MVSNPSFFTNAEIFETRLKSKYRKNDFFKSGWFTAMFAVVIPLLNGCLVALASSLVTTDVGNRFLFWRIYLCIQIVSDIKMFSV